MTASGVSPSTSPGAAGVPRRARCRPGWARATSRGPGWGASPRARRSRSPRASSRGARSRRPRTDGRPRGRGALLRSILARASPLALAFRLIPPPSQGRGAPPRPPAVHRLRRARSRRAGAGEGRRGEIPGRGKSHVDPLPLPLRRVRPRPSPSSSPSAAPRSPSPARRWFRAATRGRRPTVRSPPTAAAANPRPPTSRRFTWSPPLSNTSRARSSATASGSARRTSSRGNAASAPRGPSRTATARG